jgi:hypothetical protein
MNRQLLFKTILLFVCVTGMNYVIGQENISLYHHKNNIEKLNFNPALFKDEKNHAQLGLFTFGSGANSNFLYSDLIHKGTGDLADSLVIDIPKFRNALAKENHLSVSANTSILNLIIRTGNKRTKRNVSDYPNYFGFRISQRLSGTFLFDQNYIELLTKGNAPFYSNFFQTGQAKIDLCAFNEISISHGRQLSERLWVGLRAKVLQGLFDITTKNFSLSLQGYELDNYVDVQAQAAISISGPISVLFDENRFINDIDTQSIEINPFSMANPGYAFDFGLVYEVFEDMFLSLSVTDLGQIYWRQDIQQISLNTQYRYDPLVFDNSYDESLENYVSPSDLLDELTDDVENAFVWSDEDGKYTKKLASKFFAGLNYDINPKFNIGVAFMNSNFNGMDDTLLSLSTNMLLLNTLTFSPTFINSNGNNMMGCSLGLTVGPLQIFGAISDTSVLVNPENSYRPDIQLGLILRLEKER